jgi:subfamily B ATP-binding cassette protein HlyB/CyaB
MGVLRARFSLPSVQICQFEAEPSQEETSMREDYRAHGGRTAYAAPDWLIHIRRRGLLGEPHTQLAPGTVCLSDLTFRFSDHLPSVFINLNLRVSAGEMAAFVGPKGSGKTTLMQLIQGLHCPTRGVVLTCGRKDLGGRLHDARVAVVPRDPMLFGGTVVGNLMMADPMADFDRIMRACQRAGVHDLVMSLPAAYETEIGEGGAALKPGPRQCISLARALLRDPDILILDEGFLHCCPEWTVRLARALNG